MNKFKINFAIEKKICYVLRTFTYVEAEDEAAAKAKFKKLADAIEMCNDDPILYLKNPKDRCEMQKIIDNCDEDIFTFNNDNNNWDENEYGYIDIYGIKEVFHENASESPRECGDMEAPR